MTKIKQIIKQRNIIFGILCLVAVIGVGLGVRAQIERQNIPEIPPQTVMENVNIENYATQATDIPVEPDQPLGSVASPDFPGRYISVNKDVMFHVGGDFKDATTTIIAITNPFTKATSSPNEVVLAGTTYSGVGLTGATSTVEIVRLQTSGVATTTYITVCGAYSTLTPPPDTIPTVNILTSDGIATSSQMYLENNIASSTASALGTTAAGTVTKILLTPQLPYLVCKVVNELDGASDVTYPGAFTEITNTFDGRYSVRISKTRL